MTTHSGLPIRRRFLRVGAIFAISTALVGTAFVVTNRAPSNAAAITPASMGSGGASYCYGQLIVPQRNADTATIINQSTDLITQTIGVGAQPSAVAYSGDGHFAFIGEAGGQSITVLDTTNNSVLRVLQLGQLVFELISNYDGSIVWAYTNNLADTLVKVDTTSGSILATRQLSTNVTDFFLSPDEQTLLTIQYAYQYNNVVSYDTGSLNPLATTTLPGYSNQGALSPDGSKLYLPDANGTGVMVFDTQLLTTTTIPSGFPLFYAALSPSGTTFYSVGFSGQTTRFYVLDLLTSTWTAGIALPTVAPFTYLIGMAITADGSKVYITAMNYAAGGLFVVETANTSTANFIPTEIYARAATCPLAAEPAPAVSTTTTAAATDPLAPIFTS